MNREYGGYYRDYISPLYRAAERRSMARRRRRRGRIVPKIAGAVCILALTGILAAAGGHFLQERMKAAETVSLTGEQQVEFPELTVTVEEVAGDFYYQQLSEAEQTAYREMLQGVNGMEETIRVHAGRGDDAGKVYEYLLYDRPELFWCDGTSRMTIYEDYTEMSPGYTCPASEKEVRQAQIDAAVQQCMAGIGADASDYEKIRYVYEYIVNTVDYDENAPDNQNIYSALALRRSVCAGYSRAAQYLLKNMGIQCIYVIGNIAGQGAHAWNIVQCGGKYYQMDTTFGDPVFLEEESGESLPGSSINYDYLCCTDAEIAIDHVQDDFVEYPACSSDDLNYYRMNGMYYESFDQEELLGRMNDSIYSGSDTFVCKFADTGLYDAAIGTIVDDLLPRAAQNLAAYYGLGSVRYTYAEDREHSKLTVFWNYEENE